MPRFIVDFHIHSRYSRATSRDLTVGELAKWAKIKGVGVLGTGDFTHPLWLEELKDTLRADGHGLFEHDGMRFILTAEVNTLFSAHGKVHQIHHLLFAPSIESAERINHELESFGSLSIDGRPMLRLEPWRLVQLALGVEPRAVIIPAHVWTPWFGLFGSSSGFDTIEACFKDEVAHIFALETGLSSDPAMSWRLKALDRYLLISNSDAHSARRIGREATVFECDMAYDAMMEAMRHQDRRQVVETLEFFPEEGKYHFDGHRNCGVRWSPKETQAHHALCPTCGRKVTVGVMHRVEQLADRPEGDTARLQIPFRHVVPLEEVIAEALGVGVGTKAVDQAYFKLIGACGTEFAALLDAPEERLRQAANPRVADGILRMRAGRVQITPGYDGAYGTVRMFGGDPAPSAEQQLTLF